MISETEERRRQLLQQVKGTKRHSGGNIPAVHPSYGNAYHALYKEEDKIEKGTFQLRCVIAILCFAGFVWMKQEDVKVVSVSSGQIVDQIEKQVDLELAVHP